jgi:hypothetical protein
LILILSRTYTNSTLLSSFGEESTTKKKKKKEYTSNKKRKINGHQSEKARFKLPIE